MLAYVVTMVVVLMMVILRDSSNYSVDSPGDGADGDISGNDAGDDCVKYGVVLTVIKSD